MSEEIKKSIESTVLTILEESKRRILLKSKDLIEDMTAKIDFKKPSSFYYEYQYESKNTKELAIEIKAKELGYNPSGYFSHIYMNYSDLEFYLSEIFSKELGYTCSTDKAKYILSKILDKHLTGKNICIRRNSVITDPFSRRFNDWEKLILTNPIINSMKVEENARHVLYLLKKIRKAKRKQEYFIHDFKKWLLSTDYSKVECKIREGKFLTYEKMFMSNPIKAYGWILVKSPYIVKIYKKTISKNHC
jgi:hypothetical protein